MGILKSLVVSMLPETILLPLKKIHYRRFLKTASEDDEPDLKIVKCLVAAGDTAIDIGANIGLFTLFLSRFVGEKGKVYSFEPIGVTYKVLSSNMSSLKAGNVNLFNYGISDKNCSARMEIPKYASGGENFYQAHLVDSTSEGKSGRHIDVKMMTLDSLLPTLGGTVGFIKIDVEGHELSAINGGLRLLSDHMPALLIEISGNPDEGDSSAARIFFQLSKYGYSPYLFDGNNLKPRVAGDRSINYFLLAEKHLKSLKGKKF